MAFDIRKKLGMTQTVSRKNLKNPVITVSAICLNQGKGTSGLPVQNFVNREKNQSLKWQLKITDILKLLR